MPESRTAMHEVLLRPASQLPRAPMTVAPASLAEHELRAFIGSVADLFGPDQTKVLTEIWLDALVSMDRVPAPTSPDWRLVTLAASVRLATRVVELPNRYAIF